MKEVAQMSNGIKLRKLRLQKGLTQKQLADVAGCTPQNIRHFEGERQNIPEWKLDSITNALGVTREALIDYKVSSANDLLEILLRLEDDFGLSPVYEDDELGIKCDPQAPHAAKLGFALRQWSKMRKQLEDGEITQEEYDFWKDGHR
jgi:transcriptional regulator with XRE-family HTH domain